MAKINSHRGERQIHINVPGRPGTVTINQNAASGQSLGTYLVLQIGQSNVVGRGPSDPVNQVLAPANAFEYRPNTNSVVQLADPVGMAGDYAQATVRSLNPKFAKILVQMRFNDVIVVPVGRGNTGIDLWIDTANSNYTTALSRWNDAVAYCAANGIYVISKFAHWLQGENDAASAMAKDTYASKLNTMVDLLTDNFGIEKVFVTRIGYNDAGSVAADSERIMDAQKAMNFSKDEMIISTYSPATFTEGDKAITGNRVHYTVKGLNDVGEALAIAIDTYLQDNKKQPLLTEPVASLQDAVGYFDDIYLFRSLRPAVNNTDYAELFERNNLSLASGSLTFDAGNGLVGTGLSTPLVPATVRDLANTHDWTIEVTMVLNGGADCMMITGRASTYDNDWLWFQGSQIGIKGNGVAINTAPTGYNPNQLASYAFVYTTADNTLKIYINGTLALTNTSWTFATMRLSTFLRGYLTTPAKFFEGNLERIRIVKKALAVWEFDRSPNIGIVPTFDWLWNFDAAITEEQGDVSETFRNFSHVLLTPSYDADGLIFAQGNYIRAGQQVLLNQDFTFEFRCKSATGTGTQVIIGGKPRPTDNLNTLAFVGSPHATLRLTLPGNKDFSIAGVDTTLFHTYKIVHDTINNTLECFVDGVQKGSTLAAVPTNTSKFNIFGGGAATIGNCWYGTIDWFNFKNSV